MSDSVIGIEINRENTHEAHQCNNRFQFDMYKVRIIETKSSNKGSLDNFLIVCDRVIYLFLISLIYLYVALEEVDFQIYITSGHTETQVESDDWSIWKLIN